MWGVLSPFQTIRIGLAGVCFGRLFAKMFVAFFQGGISRPYSMPSSFILDMLDKLKLRLEVCQHFTLEIALNLGDLVCRGYTENLGAENGSEIQMLRLFLRAARVRWRGHNEQDEVRWQTSCSCDIRASDSAPNRSDDSVDRSDLKLKR